MNPSAKGAQYDSQGQARSASPLVTKKKSERGLKGRNTITVISPFQGWGDFLFLLPGATSRQSRDLPLAVILRAFGAVHEIAVLILSRAPTRISSSRAMQRRM